MKSKLRVLVLTETFPFDGNSESFFIHEMDHLCEASSVAFLPQAAQGKLYKDFNGQILQQRRWVISRELLRALPSVYEALKTDVKAMLTPKKRNRILILQSILVETTQVLKRLGRVDWEAVRKFGPSSILSLWGRTEGTSAVAAAAALNISRIVIRHHNNDLYEERTTSGFIPGIRNYIKKPGVIPVFLCSDAKKYAESKFGGKESLVLPLTIAIPKIHGRKFMQGHIRLLSISYESDVKRHWLVAKIIEVLDEQGLDFHWTHIGESRTLTQLASTMSKSITLMGSISNEAVNKVLRDREFDFLISTSQFEGLPYTMIETLVAGIPSLGTDVGCVRSALGAAAVISVESGPSEWVEFIRDSYEKRAEIFELQRKFLSELEAETLVPKLLDTLNAQLIDN